MKKYIYNMMNYVNLKIFNVNYCTLNYVKKTIQMKNEIEKRIDL